MTGEFREGGKGHILEDFVGPAQERKLFPEASEDWLKEGCGQRYSLE